MKPDKESTIIKELVLNEDEQMSGVFATSLVSNPAIEVDFVALSKELEDITKFSIDEKKMVLTGPLLIPDMLIFRNNSEEGSHYVYASAETIEKASIKFFRDGNHKNFTHQHSKLLNNNTIIYESWIIQEPKNDKSTSLGFNLPKGTWMISAKVVDKEYWDEFIKTGKIKGFSLEGLFEKVKVEKAPSKQIESNFSDENEFDEFIEFIRDKYPDLGNMPPVHKYCKCYIDGNGKWITSNEEGSPCPICEFKAKKYRNNQRNKPGFKASVNFNKNKKNKIFKMFSIKNLIEKFTGKTEEEIKLAEYILADGYVITVDEEGKAPIFDIDGNEIGYLTVTLNTEEAPVEETPMPEGEMPMETSSEETPENVEVQDFKEQFSTQLNTLLQSIETLNNKINLMDQTILDMKSQKFSKIEKEVIIEKDNFNLKNNESGLSISEYLKNRK